MIENNVCNTGAATTDTVSLLADSEVGKGADMASAECEPIMGVWGLSRQRGPGAEFLVRGAKSV